MEIIRPFVTSLTIIVVCVVLLCPQPGLSSTKSQERASGGPQVPSNVVVSTRKEVEIGYTVESDEEKLDTSDDEDNNTVSKDVLQLIESLFQCFLCPIWRSVFMDPVLTTYGHTFDYGALLAYGLQKSCPLTLSPLDPADNTWNVELCRFMDWILQRPCPEPIHDAGEWLKTLQQTTSEDAKDAGVIRRRNVQLENVLRNLSSLFEILPDGSERIRLALYKRIQDHELKDFDALLQHEHTHELRSPPRPATAKRNGYNGQPNLDQNRIVFDHVADNDDADSESSTGGLHAYERRIRQAEKNFERGRLIFRRFSLLCGVATMFGTWMYIR